MSNTRETPGKILDRALGDISGTRVPDSEVEAAGARVLARLMAEHNKVVLHPSSAEAQATDRIESCAGFQSLIPAYRSGSLTASRKLLFEDHIHSCHDCRRAMSAATETAPPRPKLVRKTRQSAPVVRWAALAAAILLVVYAGRNTIRDIAFPIDVHATAQTVNGGLFLVSGQDIRPVAAGERINRDQAVRTGMDSGAVLELADGSKIEMNSRSELSLDRAGDGVSIKLSRGSVIVTAAKQRNGHLYVATPDCTVSVVGTVFSVTSAAKGSRVSVVEGEVHVQHGSKSDAIHPGQQVSTSVAMGSNPVSNEIAWSRDKDLHLAMLKEAVAVSRDLGDRLAALPMRHSSNLLPFVPANTLVFASLPNVTQPVSESYDLMKKRISENPALNGWWTANAGTNKSGMSIDEMVRRLTRVGSRLGPEIILAVPHEAVDSTPLLLSTTPRADELAAAIRDLGGTDTPIQLVRSVAELAALGTNQDSLIIFIDQQIVVASPNARQIQRALRAANGFATSPLYKRVAQAYSEGVGWLLAADLQQVVKTGNVAQLVMEQKTGPGGATYQAVLGFNQERQGPAAWLGPAGPIGAAAFVTPNAYGAAAIVTRDPALILDDIFGMMQGDGALDEIRKFQQEHHVDLRYDLAVPMGNEFLFAVDGPIFPTPSWKVVIEINDAARTQNSLLWAVSEVNKELSNRPGSSPLVAGTEVVSGRTFYAIRSKELPVEVHYTFWAGYMIVAPSRVLLDEAIRAHDSGENLARSENFRAQLPADGRDNASGFVFQNLQAMAAMIPVDGIQETVRDAFPTLMLLYGEPDRIVVSSKGVLGTNLASMAGLAGIIKSIGIK